MNLGADMVSDETNDPLAIGGRQPLARIGESLGQPINPKAVPFNAASNFFCFLLSTSTTNREFDSENSK